MATRIPGIHNYCDRWCERCNFTAQCAVYADEQGASPDEKDIKNKAFWDRLSHNFAKAVVMLHAKAKELGIDLEESATQVTEEEKAKHERREKSRLEHPLVKMSLDYGDVSRDWRKQPAISQKANEIAQQYELGILSAQNALADAKVIKDCLEVIAWYETFISAKLMRAISGKEDDTGWEKENGFQRDCDGSAKIALIAIERSMQAWIKLYEYMPEEEDPILSLLARLEKIKKLTISEFPEAHLFKRPGFDD